uniref:Uncharacterized protein LOC109679502 n=1 Tax=Castor canadensis TaxID=51338 RepID=A0A8B7TR94_CASCN|nr:uncharacterized protein LOC109679502 [Castor canadensis]
MATVDFRTCRNRKEGREVASFHRQERCSEPERRASNDGHHSNYLIAPTPRPFLKPGRNRPLWPVSPLPLRDPEPLLPQRRRPPQGAAPRGRAHQGLRARAGRALAVLCAARRAACQRVPPPPHEVGSLSCGGGSQLLHIWLLLHIYILERASERARENEGGRELPAGGPPGAGWAPSRRGGAPGRGQRAGRAPAAPRSGGCWSGR